MAAFNWIPQGPPHRISSKAGKCFYLQESHGREFVFTWWIETTVSGAEDSMETNEAAAALLNMESPNNILDEKRMSKWFCMTAITLFFFSNV